MSTRRPHFKKEKKAEGFDGLAPHNLDAEIGVLGCCIIDPRCVGRLVALRAIPEWFFDLKHQTLFAAMLRLHAADIEVDELTLTENLRAAGELEFVGGAVYINELSNRIEVSANLEVWAEILRRHWLARRIGDQAIRLGEVVGVGHASTEELFAAARSPVEALQDLVTAPSDGTSVTDDASALLARSESWMEGGLTHDPASLVTWGIDSLDESFTPLCALEGDYLILVGARSSVGKSTFIRFVALANLLLGRIVVVHCLETSARNWMDRVAGMAARLPVKIFRDGTTRAEYLERLARQQQAILEKGGKWTDPADILAKQMKTYQQTLRWLRKIVGTQLFLFDESRDLESIQSAFRMVKKKTGRIDLGVVDYLQEVRYDDAKGRRGDEVLGYICRDIKTTAKQCGCPIILISSLNRGERGENTMPTKSSLRGSGDIEFAGDRIIFLHCPDKWNDKPQSHEDDNVYLQIQQNKARDLPTPTEWLQFMKPVGFFRGKPVDGKRGRPAGVHNGEGAWRTPLAVPEEKPES